MQKHSLNIDIPAPEPSLAQIDSALGLLIEAEEARQREKLILIASESRAPWAVREALSSSFTNIYAEGYPARRTLDADSPELEDAELSLSYYRRYGDRRYYKGTDLVNLVESLAITRVRELFATTATRAYNPSAPWNKATPEIGPDEIFANVQPLSGAAANNAVYSALISPGDTIMGLDLSQGGHLTHGSPVNRSGKLYNVVSYGVDEATGQIDYGRLESLARQHNPKIIVAGASAYPWTIDWARLAGIAKSLPNPAYLLADISHPAGLVAAGLFPNPVGLADIVTFTTHKTLIGPRAAVILTTDISIARRIDRAVFPGEQGGPHINTIAAMAVAFEIALSESFRALQGRIVENARALTESLKKRGQKLAYGGGDTHLLLIDLRAAPVAEGVKREAPLNGDLVSRILDTIGLVANKNTILGDTSALYPSGLRLGTTWATQRGLGPTDMDELAEIIHTVTSQLTTFEYIGARSGLPRGRLPFETLQAARAGVARLLARTNDAPPSSKSRTDGAAATGVLRLCGPRAALFVQGAFEGDIFTLAEGKAALTRALKADGSTLAEVAIFCANPSHPDQSEDWPCRYYIASVGRDINSLEEWLRALSDGYVLFDPANLLAKVDGPVAIERLSLDSLPADIALALREALQSTKEQRFLSGSEKPWHVGQKREAGEARPFVYPTAPESEGEKKTFSRTPLFDEHKKLGARIVPFAGYEMPVWYTSIAEEHNTVRRASGLFDLTHMGVLEVAGKGAGRFLDLVTTAYLPTLSENRARYSFFLAPDGSVLDDILIYRTEQKSADDDERFLIVVNASNNDKVLAWLEGALAGEYSLDASSPARRLDALPRVRDLRVPDSGADRLVDLAVQGPTSLELILSLVDSPSLRRAVSELRKFEFVEGEALGKRVIVSRTGYTGEPFGYELLVHPDDAPEVWRGIIERGAPFGLKPIGLGARDSLRTEAGFPLYGHELAGPEGVSPIGAGYGSFVKFHKPFFVGRDALIENEAQRARVVVRFRLNERGGRVIRGGDPVVDRRGEVVGTVTSSTIIDGVGFGMANVLKRAAAAGTALGIFPLSGPRRPEKSKAELTVGDRTLIPELATVERRFL